MNAAFTNSPEHNPAKKPTDWYRSFFPPLSALLLALSGQWLLLESEFNPFFPVLLFAASVSLYLFSIFGWPAAALRPQPLPSLGVTWWPIIHSRQWRAVLIIYALILAIESFNRFKGNMLDNGFWTWLGSIVLFLVAVCHIPESSIQEFFAACADRWKRLDRRLLLMLALIVLLAIFFRFFRLQEVPLEMTSDHAEKLLDVQDVLDGERPIFFPRNTGRELFQFYFTAGLIHLTGLQTGFLSLKVGTAIFGVLAVPFTYLLGRLLYGQFVGLLAAFFLSISHWHVAITRVGLRFPFTAAFATPALFFLLLALRDNKRNYWLLSALFLGIGLHTYTAMRVVPLLFIVLISLKLLADGIKKITGQSVHGVDSWSSKFWINGSIAFFFSILLLLPLLRVMYDDPRILWARALSRAQTDTNPTITGLASQFLENTKNAILMFNVQGDVVPINTIPGEPVLGLVSGALFILGLSFLFWRLLSNRDNRSMILLISLFFLILPSILSLAYPGENPSVVRTGGAVPIVMIIAAIPLATIVMRLWTSHLSLGYPVAIAVICLLVLAATIDNYDWYFNDYDQHVRYSIWNSTELGDVLKAFENDGANVANAFHIAYPHWVDTRNIGINAGHVRWNNAIVDRQVLYKHTGGLRPRLYLLHLHDRESLLILQELFPDGNIERYDSPNEGRDFIIFHVPQTYR